MNRAVIRSKVRIDWLLPVCAVSMCVVPASGSEHYSWDLMLGGEAQAFDLTWRTASAPTGNGSNPPFMATWSDIKAVATTGGMCLRNDDLQLRGAATYGRIVGGTSSISAYADDSRTQTTYRSDQRSDGGDVRGATVALGMIIKSSGGALQAIGEFGYTYSEQRLTMTDGVQVVPATGAYAGLDSSYRSVWQGAWIGMSGSWRVLDSWSLIANGRFQMVEYRGELDYNLRTDLAHPRSIEQSGDGFAFAVGAGIACQVSRSLTIDLVVGREESRISDGKDRVHYRNGSSDDVPLLDAVLMSWTLRCGLRWEL